MDIDLLSKMVKELILDNDRVVLPGLGCFVAEMVPSTFSDKGYTINPPYRRLYFRARPDQGDALTRFYASSNNVELEIADKIINDFIAEMKPVLFSRKTVVFPGLGRLRATKENTVFFIADEDLDIYPGGFGLEPVSLKTHQESPAEVSAAVEELKSMLDETVQPVPETMEPESVEQTAAEPESVEKTAAEPEPVVPEVAEPETIPVPEDPVIYPEPVAPIVETGLTDWEEDYDMPTSRRPLALYVFLGILAVAVIALVAFVVLSRVCPEFVDGLLYSPEELEIIRNYM